ncbi:hypothetical protein MOC92_21655, partial [Bacillus haynesii]|nr:hypothetical protein [Bacillus haynesii]
AVCYALQYLFAIDSLLSLFVTALSATGAYGLFAYFVMLTKAERHIVTTKLQAFRCSLSFPFQKGFFK